MIKSELRRSAIILASLAIAASAFAADKKTGDVAKELTAALSPIAAALDTPVMKQVLDERDHQAVLQTAVIFFHDFGKQGGSFADFDDPLCSQPFSAFSKHLRATAAEALREARIPKSVFGATVKNETLTFDAEKRFHLVLLGALVSSEQKALWIRRAEYEALKETMLPQETGVGWPSIISVSELVSELDDSNNQMIARFRSLDRPPTDESLLSSLRMVLKSDPSFKSFSQQANSLNKSLAVGDGIKWARRLAFSILNNHDLALEKLFFFHRVRTKKSSNVEQAVDSLPPGLSTQIEKCLAKHHLDDERKVPRPAARTARVKRWQDARLGNHIAAVNPIVAAAMTPFVQEALEVDRSTLQWLVSEMVVSELAPKGQHTALPLNWKAPQCASILATIFEQTARNLKPKLSELSNVAPVFMDSSRGAIGPRPIIKLDLVQEANYALWFAALTGSDRAIWQREVEEKVGTEVLKQWKDSVERIPTAALGIANLEKHLATLGPLPTVPELEASFKRLLETDPEVVDLVRRINVYRAEEAFTPDGASQSATGLSELVWSMNHTPLMATFTGGQEQTDEKARRKQFISLWGSKVTPENRESIQVCFKAH